MISTVMSGRFRERGTQDRLGRMFDGGDTHGAGGFVAKFAQIGNALIEIVKHRCKRLHKSLAGLGRRCGPCVQEDAPPDAPQAAERDVREIAPIIFVRHSLSDARIPTTEPRFVVGARAVIRGFVTVIDHCTVSGASYPPKRPRRVTQIPGRHPTRSAAQGRYRRD